MKIPRLLCTGELENNRDRPREYMHKRDSIPSVVQVDEGGVLWIGTIVEVLSRGEMS